MRYLLTLLLLSIPLIVSAMETTPYGKITGIETRPWGMHVQVDYAAGKSIGCEVRPGMAYMLDLNESKVNQNGENYELSQSLILAAFLAQKDVSFHLYECGSQRPYIGHVRVRS